MPRTWNNRGEEYYKFENRITYYNQKRAQMGDKWVDCFFSIRKCIHLQMLNECTHMLVYPKLSHSKICFTIAGIYFDSFLLAEWNFTFRFTIYSCEIQLCMSHTWTRMHCTGKWIHYKLLQIAMYMYVRYTYARQSILDILKFIPRNTIRFNRAT